ncbi:MAG: ABC transporter ATP-binding protein [Planctomycetes bacterium]|nr:ABC transporter ATP-binding protein [Planctomycetota bacterium]
MSSILQASGLTKVYREGGSAVYALRSLNLAIEEGETLAVTGESGAGKSTLLHMLGLLDVPTAGSVSYRGRRLEALTSTEMADIRNTHFGFVFQFFRLLPDLSALENVMLPDMIASSYLGWWLGKKRKLAQEALEKVGLAQRVRHRPSQLSGGEKQRVAIARALVRSPDVIFCDEPTGNLDSKTSEEIHNLIFDLNRTTGRTFVIVTHDTTLESRARRIVNMEDGSIREIIRNGSPPEHTPAKDAAPTG